MRGERKLRHGVLRLTVVVQLDRLRLRSTVAGTMQRGLRPLTRPCSELAPSCERLGCLKLVSKAVQTAVDARRSSASDASWEAERCSSSAQPCRRTESLSSTPAARLLLDRVGLIWRT